VTEWPADILLGAIGEHALCNTKEMQLAQKDGSCLVYGVGIFNDWRFEKTMAQLGCEVHAFDPTISKPPTEEPNLPNLHFHQWGLAGQTDLHGEHEVHGSIAAVSAGGEGENTTTAPMMSLVDIMQKLGHAGRNLTVLKADCEGCEWEALQAVPKELWQRIGQLSLELHFSKSLMLDSAEALHSAAQVALALKEAGFKKWRNSMHPGYKWDQNLRPDLVEAGMQNDQCCRLAGLYRDP
jgi:FkbM family methyltransferase